MQPAIPVVLMPGSTIRVRVAPKTRAHRYYGMGSPYGYVVDGVEGGTMHVLRDAMYRIDVEPMPVGGSTHPLYASTAAMGGAGAPAPLRGVTGVGVVGSAPFHVDAHAPSAFFYACTVHPWMGGNVVVHERWAPPPGGNVNNACAIC